MACGFHAGDPQIMDRTVALLALFESLAQPFAILFSIPFSLVGATWFLAATGTPFNLMAQPGVLILMGIVVNNGIVLLDRVRQYRALGHGREEAILLAGRDRLRLILMTALCTVLGLLPLALGRSGVGGWAYYYPLARTVMGGLLSSTVLTLVVLPYISYGIESLALRFRRLWAATTAMPEAAPPRWRRCWTCWRRGMWPRPRRSARPGGWPCGASRC